MKTKRMEMCKEVGIQWKKLYQNGGKNRGWNEKKSAE